LVTKAGLITTCCLAAAACGRIGFDPASTSLDATTDSSLAVGLIHHWPCDEPVGSTVAHDVVGGADAMVVAPAAFTSAGHGGNGLASHAGGYAFLAAPPADIEGIAQVTLSAWMQRSIPNAIEEVGEETIPVDMNNELSIDDWSDGLLYFCIGQWDTTCASTPDGNDTSWHLVTLVFDGSQPTPQTKLLGYLDGELQSLTYEQGGPYPTATPTYDEHWDLDAVSDNEGQDAGTIDDARIWARTLSAAEVAALYTGTR
jgi:hypothetical protein